MQTIQKYSPEQRAEALQRVALRGDQTIEQVADACGVLVYTLKGWMRAARRTRVGSGSNPSSGSYRPAQQLDALVETAHLDGPALALRGHPLLDRGVWVPRSKRACPPSKGPMPAKP